MSEEWRPIPGYPGYEASSEGRIRSFRRKKNGVALVMKPNVRLNYDYLSVGVRHDNATGRRRVNVHTLVAAAFLGPRPRGLEARHLNGNPRDNRVTNLVYGTRSENLLDKVRHGTDFHVRKTHCPQGHPYDLWNTVRTSSGGRRCGICHREQTRLAQQRRRARLRAARAA